MLKKLTLLAAAILAAGVITSACSGGGGGGGGAHSLASGTYELTVLDVPANTCFPSSLTDLLVGLSLSIDIVSTNGESFLLVTEPPVNTFLPPVEGTIDGNDLNADGAVAGLPLGTNGCLMDISATAVGELTGDDEFTAALTANLSVPQSAASACSPYVGENLPLDSPIPIPFPTLTNGSSGTCSLTLDTEGILPPS